jgi:hypothetical protein
MTLVEFIKDNLPNYEERKHNLFRIQKDKSISQWHIDRFPEAYMNFENNKGKFCEDYCNKEFSENYL